ncbi:hypothetical protein GQ457_11G019950 [Hibiscus cannabinus]
MGEIQLALTFTCPLIQVYLQLMHDLCFPRCTTFTCGRLSRADPQLRKEVVQSMLDAGQQLWSPRRANANIKRLMEARKWFD